MKSKRERRTFVYLMKVRGNIKKPALVMRAHSSASEVQGIHNNVCLQMAGGCWLLPMDRRGEASRGESGAKGAA